MTWHVLFLYDKNNMTKITLSTKEIDFDPIDIDERLVAEYISIFQNDIVKLKKHFYENIDLYICSKSIKNTRNNIKQKTAQFIVEHNKRLEESYILEVKIIDKLINKIKLSSYGHKTSLFDFMLKEYGTNALRAKLPFLITGSLSLTRLLVPATGSVLTVGLVGYVGIGVFLMLILHGMLNSKDLAVIKSFDKDLAAIAFILTKYGFNSKIAKTSKEFKNCIQLKCNDEKKIKQAKSKIEKKITKQQILECSHTCYMETFFKTMDIFIESYIKFLDDNGENVRSNINDFDSLMRLPLSEKNIKVERLSVNLFNSMSRLIAVMFKPYPLKRKEFLDKIDRRTLYYLKKLN